MKKSLFSLMTLLFAFLCAQSVGAAEKTVLFQLVSGPDDAITADATVSAPATAMTVAGSAAQDGITLSWGDGLYDTSAAFLRTGTMTVSAASGSTLKSVLFTFDGSGYDDFTSDPSNGWGTSLSSGSFGSAAGYKNTAALWTPSNQTTASVTFTLEEVQVEVQQILVTYEVEEGGTVDPEPDPDPVTPGEESQVGFLFASGANASAAVAQPQTMADKGGTYTVDGVTFTYPAAILSWGALTDASGDMVFTAPAGSVLKKIVFSISPEGDYYAGDLVKGMTPDAGSFEEVSNTKELIWTGSSETVTIAYDGSKYGAGAGWSYCYPYGVSVYYESNGGDTPEPPVAEESQVGFLIASGANASAAVVQPQTMADKGGTYTLDDVTFTYPAALIGYGALTDASGDMVFTAPAGSVLKKIVFNINPEGDYYASDLVKGMTPDSGSFEEVTNSSELTWTGSSETVTIAYDGSKYGAGSMWSYCYLYGVSVYYVTEGGDTPEPPVVAGKSGTFTIRCTADPIGNVTTQDNLYGNVYDCKNDGSISYDDCTMSWTANLFTQYTTDIKLLGANGTLKFTAPSGSNIKEVRIAFNNTNGAYYAKTNMTPDSGELTDESKFLVWTGETPELTLAVKAYVSYYLDYISITYESATVAEDPVVVGNWTLNNEEVTSVSIETPGEYTLPTWTFTDGVTADDVTFTSDNEEVVEVSAEGVLTVKEGVSGTANVVAAPKTDDGSKLPVSLELTVTYTAPAVEDSQVGFVMVANNATAAAAVVQPQTMADKGGTYTLDDVTFTYPASLISYGCLTSGSGDFVFTAPAGNVLKKIVFSVNPDGGYDASDLVKGMTAGVGSFEEVTIASELVWTGSAESVTFAYDGSKVIDSSNWFDTLNPNGVSVYYGSNGGDTPEPPVVAGKSGTFVIRCSNEPLSGYGYDGETQISLLDYDRSVAGSLTYDDCTMTWSAGIFTTEAGNADTQFPADNGTMTFKAPEGSKLQEIKFYFYNSGTSAKDRAVPDNGEVSWADNVLTWTGDSDAVSFNVTKSGYGTKYWTMWISVTYKGNGGEAEVKPVGSWDVDGEAVTEAIVNTYNEGYTVPTWTFTEGVTADDVTFASDNEALATIDAEGVITIVDVESAGNVNFTATPKDAEKYSEVTLALTVKHEFAYPENNKQVGLWLYEGKWLEEGAEITISTADMNPALPEFVKNPKADFLVYTISSDTNVVALGNNGVAPAPIFIGKVGQATLRSYNSDGKLAENTLIINVTDIPTGIDSVEADDNATYFDLQGNRVEGDRLVKGVYIRVSGDKAEKVLVK